MNTSTPAPTPAQPKPTGSSAWLALAGTGAATLAASAANADAALVQITQTNIHAGGNYISTSGFAVVDNQFNADLTGDGAVDVPWVGVGFGLYQFGIGRGAFAGGGPQGFVAITTASTGGVLFPTPAGRIRLDSPMVTASASIFAFGSASVSRLANVVFTDTNYGVGPITALAEIVADTSLGFGASSSVTISRLIFNDTDASGGAELAALDHTNVGASYSEAQAVPEPSRLALLTLGAGGILARRRRKTAA